MDNNNNNNNDNDFNNIHNANNQTFNTILNILNTTISGYNDNITSYNNNITSLLRILNIITENVDLSDASNLFNTINRNRDIRHPFTSPRSEPVFRNTPNVSQPRRFIPRPIQRSHNITNRTISPRIRNRNDIYNPLRFPRVPSIEQPVHNFTPQLRLSRETILHDDNIESLSDLFGNLNLSFQNVPVYPSLNQIQNATRSYNYTSQELNDNPNEICPITMEEFEINDEVCIINYCNHIFKKEALYRWFTNNVRCPICRYDIRDFVPDTQTVISNDISNNSQIINDVLSSAIGESVRTFLELELQIPLSRTNSIDSSHNIISP